MRARSEVWSELRTPSVMGQDTEYHVRVQVSSGSPMVAAEEVARIMAAVSELIKAPIVVEEGA